MLARILLRTNPDYDPRHRITKRLDLHDYGKWHIDWFVSRLYEINTDYSASATQNTGSDFHNPSERRWVSDCPHALGTISRIESHAFCPFECSGEWLAFLLNHHVVVALHVESAI